jgi:hypothetical protein
MCRAQLPTQAELQAHVQAHFDDQGAPGAPAASAPIPVATTIAPAGSTAATAATATSPSSSDASGDSQANPWWKRIFGGADPNATTNTTTNTGNKEVGVPQPPVFSYAPMSSTASKLPANAQLVTQRGTQMYYRMCRQVFVLS